MNFEMINTKSIEINNNMNKWETKNGCKILKGLSWCRSNLTIKVGGCQSYKNTHGYFSLLYFYMSYPDLYIYKYVNIIFRSKYYVNKDIIPDTSLNPLDYNKNRLTRVYPLHERAHQYIDKYCFNVIHVVEQLLFDVAL